MINKLKNNSKIKIISLLSAMVLWMYVMAIVDPEDTKIFENIKSTNVVLDLSQVTTMDSTGMGMLFACFNKGLDTGFKLYLMNMSFAVINTVKETGFLEAFNVITSVTEVQ